MKKKLIQLTGMICLLVIGILGVDLTSNSNGDLVFGNVFTVVEARGCGVGYYNHHRPLGTVTLCFDGGTFIGFGTGHDCVVSDQDCCKIPNNENPCQTLAL